MSQTNAKIAYGEELQKAQEYLQALQVALTTARGDGNFSDKIHWGHVGDVKYLNSILEQGLQVELKRVE